MAAVSVTKMKVETVSNKDLFLLVWSDGSVRLFVDEVKRDEFLDSWNKGQEIEGNVSPQP